MMNLPLFI